MGCSKGEEEPVEYDIRPIFFKAYVIDSSGNNLLDENTTGNILHNGITVQCEDKIFELKLPQSQKSRDIYAEFNGIRLIDFPDLEKSYLYIGTWMGDYNYQNKEVILDWKDGTKDTIAFDHTYEKRRTWTLDVRLNGKDIEYCNRDSDGYLTFNPITFVK